MNNSVPPLVLDGHEYTFWIRFDTGIEVSVDGYLDKYLHRYTGELAERLRAHVRVWTLVGAA